MHTNPSLQPHAPHHSPPATRLPLVALLLVLVVPQPLIHVLALGPRLAHLLLQPLAVLVLVLARLAACGGGSGRSRGRAGRGLSPGPRERRRGGRAKQPPANNHRQHLPVLFTHQTAARRGPGLPEHRRSPRPSPRLWNETRGRVEGGENSGCRRGPEGQSGRHRRAGIAGPAATPPHAPCSGFCCSCAPAASSCGCSSSAPFCLAPSSWSWSSSCSGGGQGGVGGEGCGWAGLRGWGAFGAGPGPLPLPLSLHPSPQHPSACSRHPAPSSTQHPAAPSAPLPSHLV